MTNQELLSELQRLLNPPLWDADQIGTYLNMSRSTVRRLTLRPDFPKPLMFSEERTRRWIPREVQAWAERQRSR